MRNKIQLLSFLILSVFNVYAQEAPLKAYYFPLDKLSEPKVYVYQNQMDNTAEYWIMMAQEVDGDMILTTSLYDNQFALREITTELVEEHQATIIRLQLMAYDDDGEQIISNCYLFKDQAFNFQNVSVPITYKFITDDPNGDNLINQKTRRYTGENLAVTFNEKQVDCIKIQDQVISKYIGRDLKVIEEFSHEQIHYYAKGIGRLRSELNYPDKQEIKVLQQIITLDEFRELIGKMN